jgi:Fur family ferric uptake transcriptional regulator
MTISPDARPLACGNLAEAVAALRARGLRLSTARRLVLKALFAVEAPVSAEHIAQLGNLELTSVYRNLEVLERHGLVRHVHLGHGPGLYALRLHGEPEYLFCERCGSVRAVPSDELDDIRAQVKERYGYEVRFAHFAIVGTCPTCAAAQLHNEHDREGE